MRHQASEKRAEKAARQLRTRFDIDSNDVRRQPRVGIVLGTGWGDALGLKVRGRIPFGDIAGFPELEALEGHAREVVYGSVGGTPVIALRGRVHVNEAPADPDIHRAVRLQIEMLLQLGVKHLILTCAAGSLKPDVKVGDLVLVDRFCTLYAPDMPLYAGEFCSPEDAIGQTWIDRIVQNRCWKKVKRGAHIMVRGPFFESRKIDKGLLAQTGCDVVGMSVLPEACIAALYGASVLPVAFVTNTANEEHSHEENVRRLKAASGTLGLFLTHAIIRRDR